MSRKSLTICLLVSVVALKFQTGLAEDLPDWTSQIRKDHPRLFFNNDTWPAVKQRALGPEEPAWRALKASVDRRLVESHSKSEPRELGGHIVCRGEEPLDRPLTNAVAPQQGVLGGKQ